MNRKRTKRDFKIVFIETVIFKTVQCSTKESIIKDLERVGTILVKLLIVSKYEATIFITNIYFAKIFLF